MKRVLMVVAASVLVGTSVHGQSLTISDVRAPEINCFYGLRCSVIAHDSLVSMVPHGEGVGFVQLRMIEGERNPPFNTRYGYQFRIDRRNVKPGRAHGCISSVTVGFASPITYADYDDDGGVDDVYVIRQSGLGSIAPTSAMRAGDRLSFHFEQPVCDGASTVFFGVTSPLAPTALQVKLLAVQLIR